MKRLALLVLVLSACQHQGHEVQPGPEDQADPEDQTNPYIISLLIDNKSGYLIALGGVGLVFGSVLPGEQKCVRLPNNDAKQQLWFLGRSEAANIIHWKQCT
jgi:hypothetical protein